KYLDDFRNYRERARSVTPAEGGRKIYDFGGYDKDAPTPYRQVEDAVGDQNDPAAFPRDFRLAYYRDGTVRRYLVTEPGDILAQLNKPDSARWHKVLPDVQDWQGGTVEPLAPFAPAVSQTGALLPGRILVLSFAPKAQETGSNSGRALTGPAASALRCLGGPVAPVGGVGLGRLALGRVARSSRAWHD